MLAVSLYPSFSVICLQGAVKSAFAKLEVRDSKIADALMGRIMAGTEPIEPQQICSSTSSKRPCFLVLRKSLESKSPFQISVPKPQPIQPHPTPPLCFSSFFFQRGAGAIVDPGE